MDFLRSIVFQSEQFPGSPEFRTLLMAVLDNQGQLWGFRYTAGTAVKVFRIADAQENFADPDREPDFETLARAERFGMTSFRHVVGQWMQDYGKGKINKSAGRDTMINSTPRKAKQ